MTDTKESERSHLPAGTRWRWLQRVYMLIDAGWLTGGSICGPSGLRYQRVDISGCAIESAIGVPALCCSEILSGDGKAPLVRSGAPLVGETIEWWKNAAVVTEVRGETCRLHFRDEPEARTADYPWGCEAFKRVATPEQTEPKRSDPHKPDKYEQHRNDLVDRLRRDGRWEPGKPLDVLTASSMAIEDNTEDKWKPGTPTHRERLVASLKSELSRPAPKRFPSEGRSDRVTGYRRW